jgi:hypothetical protein
LKRDHVGVDLGFSVEQKWTGSDKKCGAEIDKIRKKR